MQPVDEPRDLDVLHGKLRDVVLDMRRMNRERDCADIDVHLPQFDVTRDLGGCFWAKGDWRRKHEAIRKALQSEFKTVLRNNGNSMQSCFQFEETPRPDRPSIRIKVYDKLLSLMQHETVQKRIGMNTSTLYYPSLHLNKTLKEFKHEGITRVEISYYADSVQSEDKLINGEFID